MDRETLRKRTKLVWKTLGSLFVLVGVIYLPLEVLVVLLLTLVFVVVLFVVLTFHMWLFDNEDSARDRTYREWLIWLRED